MKVLFVCTGNTCRSPMAEGIFRRFINNEGMQDRIFCQSAGLSAADGMPASENAVLACRESGIDLSGHKARRITSSDIDMWDIFFPMTPTHAYVLEKAGVPLNKIFVPSTIEDPYGGDLECYRSVKSKLEKEIKLFYNGEVQRRLLFENNQVS